MRSFSFVTVDVFTEKRFSGNPLAVFIDAEGLSGTEMQALAAEMNYSETTFVLPPDDPAHDARVRIFHRTAEMPFAGHPNIGTAFVLAHLGRVRADMLRFEQVAGIVEVRIDRDAAGRPIGAGLKAPQPLQRLGNLPPAEVAACLGLQPAEIVTTTHRPVRATVGVEFTLVEVTAAALPQARPDRAAFERVADDHLGGESRLSILLYARQGRSIRSRMFAPLSGTWEDPATGSASATLAALLLSLDGAPEAIFDCLQGVEVGRPSHLRTTAWRDGDSIRASVAGACVTMLSGTVEL